MSKKKRKFADDGWAVWIDGEDTSTIHINDWLNPMGKSFVDIAIHIRGIKLCKSLNVYARLLWPWDFPGKNTGVGCHFLLQGIFLTRVQTNISCFSCIGRQILYDCTT